jgi:quercetin dioxygenase-like cupin family protein
MRLEPSGRSVEQRVHPGHDWFFVTEGTVRLSLGDREITVETGKHTISLDILLPLTEALQVDLDALLDVHSDDDVVIRPAPSSAGARTTWMLSRPTGSTIAVKMRLEPTRTVADQRVHPGHDWFFVLEGRVRLSLGEREITVETGEAAEFATMTPHAVEAIDGPAELIMIFDRDGQRAHVHHDHPTS